MRKAFYLSLLTFFFAYSVQANVSKDVSKAAKAVIGIVTYDKDGKLLRSGNGFFIQDNGTAISGYALFKGAARAEAIDARGKKYPVEYVMGVHDMYDLIKIRVRCDKPSFLSMAKTAVEVGGTYYILPSMAPKAVATETTLDSIENIEGGSYYALHTKYKVSDASCPVTNSKGELVGIIQRSSDATSNTFAISANIAEELSIKAVSATNSALRALSLPVSLPEEQKEALSYLYLLQQNKADSVRYLQALNQFIVNFDKAPDGYIERARYYASLKQYALCEADLEEALKKEGDKASVHYAKSKIVYQKNLYDPSSDYKDWTLQLALREAENAYSINPLPLYKLMQADCYYGMKEYERAYQCYDTVNASSFASAETFYYAARAKEKTNAEPAVLVALMDSAINRYSKPYPPVAAPYFLERARYLNAAKEYRRSILDYNEYEHLVGFKRLNDKFYYIREQVALQGRLYQQAINDIQRAISLNPKEYIYQVELAALMLRTGQIDEAIQAAGDALKLRSDDSDAYKILGIAWGEKRDKTKSLTYLRKAKELGDQQVEELIKQYE